MNNLNKIKVIAFDADDTLWENINYFFTVEKEFCKLLSEYAEDQMISTKQYETECKNLPNYGYGSKSFTLSMLETALLISKGSVSTEVLEKILLLGTSLLKYPIHILPNVVKTLDNLYNKYRLIVATKGDYVEQYNKYKRSGLSKYFCHLEIMPDKNIENYDKLLRYLKIKPEEFLMVGNSVKSDILPVISLGSTAVYVPFPQVWLHEEAEIPKNNDNFYQIKELSELLTIIK